MSDKTTPITNELENYLKSNFSADDEFLNQLKLDAKNHDMPDIYISSVQAKFMQFLLKLMNAKYILEIGTLGGYSAITMARALPEDGKVITIELFEKHADFAKKKIKEAGLDNKIEVINQRGMEFLNSFRPTFELDFVFVDADKDKYWRYLELTTPLIRKGGVFAADNAFAFGFLLDTAPERSPEDVKSIKSFNEHFKNHEAYETTLVPIGDGLIMGIKK